MKAWKTTMLRVRGESFGAFTFPPQAEAQASGLALPQTAASGVADDSAGRGEGDFSWRREGRQEQPSE